VIWRFITCGKQESFVFSKRPDCFLGFFSVYSVSTVHVFILLALTVHFTSPYIKRNCTVHPATGHEGPEESRGVALHFLERLLKMGWVVKVKLRPLYPRQTNSVPTGQEAVWAPERF
jgi:hypothetical protein